MAKDSSSTTATQSSLTKPGSVANKESVKPGEDKPHSGAPTYSLFDNVTRDPHDVARSLGFLPAPVVRNV